MDRRPARRRPESGDGRRDLTRGGGDAAACAHLETPATHLVLTSPSSVTWQAVTDGPVPGVSSWTLHGKPVPFAELDGDALATSLLRSAFGARGDRRAGRPTLMHLRPGYESGLPRSGSDADIPVENVPTLTLVAGTDDALWPSQTMAEAIAARRRREDDSLVACPGAGHYIVPPLAPTTVRYTSGVAFGGTTHAQARAAVAAWQATLAAVAAAPGGYAGSAG